MAGKDRSRGISHDEQIFTQASPHMQLDRIREPLAMRLFNPRHPPVHLKAFVASLQFLTGLRFDQAVPG